VNIRVWSKRHPIPEGVLTRYVGRPSIFGNPFVVGRDGTIDDVLDAYEEWMYAPEQRELRDRARRELAGLDLVCWCAPFGGIDATSEPAICHAQILARVVNGAAGK
jgi:hypothetical protein